MYTKYFCSWEQLCRKTDVGTSVAVTTRRRRRREEKKGWGGGGAVSITDEENRSLAESEYG